jgi:tetratricopeptide (TPR) repeat protein
MVSTQAGATRQSEAVEVLLDSAVRHVEQTEYEQAAVVLERALRIEPGSAEIWHLLGQVRLHQGQYAQAEAMAQKSNALAANNMDLRQRNQHLISLATKLDGQPMAPRPAAAIASRTWPSDVSKPLVTATQPVVIQTRPEPLPVSSIAVLSPSYGVSPAQFPVQISGDTYQPEIQTVHLISAPDQSRNDYRVESQTIPIVNMPLAGGALRVDLLLRDMLRYRAERDAVKIKFKSKKSHKKHKKHKKQGKSGKRN